MSAARSAPSIDQFAVVLFKGPDWYSLGVFLGAPFHELDPIKLEYSGIGVIRCMIELYKCLVRLGKAPSWDSIASILKSIGYTALAEEIVSTYIQPSLKPPSSSSESSSSSSSSDSEQSDADSVEGALEVPSQVFKQYTLLSLKLTKLNMDIKNALKASNENLQDVQNIMEYHCGRKPYSTSRANWENVFRRVLKSSIFDDPHVLRFIVNAFLSKNLALSREMEEFEKEVNSFKSSTEIHQLVDQLKKRKKRNRQVISLKLNEQWCHCTIKKFETAMKKLLGSLYRHLSYLSVVNGCYCISWIISADVPHASQLLPKHSKELFKIIGVISLQIGEEMVYDSTGEVPGCEVLEAAMLQAIELKNTRAIELLLAVGCSPEVATYNGDHAVTNVVNIRERSVDDGSGGGVDHVCVLGHNEHIEAIIDTSERRVPKCATCIIKEDQIKRLYMQVDTFQLENKKLRDPQQKELINEALSSEYDAKKGVDIF